MITRRKLVKRAMKGQLGLFQSAQTLMNEILLPTSMEEDADGPLNQESRMVENAKKMFFLASRDSDPTVPRSKYLKSRKFSAC